MPPERPDTALEKATATACSPLVIAVAREELRRWAVLEVAANWQGPVHIVDGVPEMLRGAYGRRFVLMLCPDNLEEALRSHPRRWPNFARRASVVLLETVANLDRMVSLMSFVDSVLVAGLHDGRAMSIIRAAKIGMLALPPALLERLLRKPPSGSQGSSAGAPPNSTKRGAAAPEAIGGKDPRPARRHHLH